jgi:hypothetical protein
MEVTFFVFLGAAAVLYSLWRVFHWLRHHDDSVILKPSPSRTAESAAIAIQAAVTAIAIVAAGVWYYFERTGKPHADVAMQVAGAKIEDGLVLIEVQVFTKNLGRRLLKTNDWNVRLQTVTPTSLPVKTIARLPAGDWPEKIGDQRVYSEQAIEWPTIKMFEGQNRRETEPGEVDAVPFDFIVGCETKVARLVVFVKKEDSFGARIKQSWRRAFGGQAGERPADGSNSSSNSGRDDDAKPGWWWSRQALVPVQDLCSKPAGSVVRWKNSGSDGD